MLSNKCKYALRAILLLAVESSKEHKIRGNALAENLKIPTAYLGKILQELVPKGVISSTKGPNGGFYLTEKNLEMPLLDVIEAIDSLDYFEKCGLGLTACSDSSPCPIHEDFKVGRNHIKEIFANKTIRKLATEITDDNLILVR